MSEQMLDISKIRIDGDTQPRLAIDQIVVTEYAEAMEAGTEFPPVQVVSDGAVHWLVDGFHRYFAHRKLGRKQIKAEVTTGLLEEAQWLSLGANKAHGLRRTNQDKAKAVIKAIKMKPNHSDGAIAEHVGVADVTVAKYRASMEESRKLREGKTLTAKTSGPRILDLTTRIGKDGKKYPVRTRGKPPVSPQAATPIRGHSPPPEKKTHLAMPENPEAGAYALASLFDAAYLERLVVQLAAIINGTAGPPPAFKDLPTASTAINESR